LPISQIHFGFWILDFRFWIGIVYRSLLVVRFSLQAIANDNNDAQKINNPKSKI